MEFNNVNSLINNKYKDVLKSYYNYDISSVLKDEGQNITDIIMDDIKTVFNLSIPNCLNIDINLVIIDLDKNKIEYIHKTKYYNIFKYHIHCIKYNKKYYKLKFNDNNYDVDKLKELYKTQDYPIILDIKKLI